MGYPEVSCKFEDGNPETREKFLHTAQTQVTAGIETLKGKAAEKRLPRRGSERLVERVAGPTLIWKPENIYKK